MVQIKDINKFKMNYAKIFHSKVQPALLSFENQRIKTRNIAVALSAITFFVIAIGLYYFMGMGQLTENFFYGLIFIAAFGGFPAYTVYRFFKKSFETKIKMAVMPLLMPAFGNFQWMQLAVIRDGEIRRSKLFTRFERMEDDDNFTGSYKDVPIRICEAELTYITTNSRGERTKHTEFKGVLISLDIPKNFTGHTIIRERNLINLGPYQEVKLEDPEFSKKFYVSSTDQIEARYLLTTAFMQRYKNIQKAFNASTISCSFLANRLLLAIPSCRDLFSLGDLNTPADNTNQFTTFLNEIVSILELIEELKVYQNTGL